MTQGEDESIDGELLQNTYTITLTSLLLYILFEREASMSFSQTQCLSYGHINEHEISLSFFKGTLRKGSLESSIGSET
ncbi:hypothetical protein Bca4012_036868 [Brassica carinata]